MKLGTAYAAIAATKSPPTQAAPQSPRQGITSSPSAPAAAYSPARYAISSGRADTLPCGGDGGRSHRRTLALATAARKRVCVTVTPVMATA